MKTNVSATGNSYEMLLQNRNSRVFLMAFFFAAIALMTVPSISRAQCPTDIEPTNITWGGQNTASFLLPGTNCAVIYHYCFRIVNGIQQYFIEDYEPDPNHWSTDCNDITWYDLLTDVKNNIYSTLAGGGPCDQGVSTTVSIFTGQCIKMVQDLNLNPSCMICDGEGYCETTCDICHNSLGQLVETNCSTTMIYTADCPQFADWPYVTIGETLDNGPWGYPYDTCFLLGCQ